MGIPTLNFREHLVSNFNRVAKQSDYENISLQVKLSKSKTLTALGTIAACTVEKKGGEERFISPGCEILNTISTERARVCGGVWGSVEHRRALWTLEVGWGFAVGAIRHGDNPPYPSRDKKTSRAYSWSSSLSGYMLLKT